MKLRTKKMITSILLTCVIYSINSLAVVAKEQGISRQQAIAIVKDNFSGKVLKVQLKETPRARFYKVKLLTKDGRVKQLRVDSASGEILNKK
jgi:uncharacterized membrane protein YkoI